MNFSEFTPPEFVTSEPIDLTNCDREPIHIPGLIQSHGVLLTLQNSDLTILQASQNADRILGIEAAALVGQPLSRLFSSDQIDQITNYLSHNRPEVFNPFELRFPSVDAETDSIFYKGIIHCVDQAIALELEPQLYPNHNLIDFYPLLRDAIANLRNASNLTNLTQIIVQEVKRLTGFDRVMVYRFATDYSGVVVAEAKQEQLESFLGLHYPASDIPVQARKLYYENWLRLIPDVNYQPVPLLPVNNPLTNRPLDLSAAVLRSVSPLHIEYLQNMGITASMSISLINEKQLWGLIACHHYTPKYVDYEIRKACEFLGQFASIELVHQQDREASLYRKFVKAIQEQMRQVLSHQTGSIEQVLNAKKTALLDLVRAQGVAIFLNQQLTLVGDTPDEDDVHQLINWLLNQNQQELFYTDALPQIYPAASAFTDRASGLLAISVVLQPTSYHIIWFRPEQVQTVDWAGNPNKPVSVNAAGDMRLSPRKSFELWKETVRERSLPWQPLELEAAQEMRNTLMLAALKFSQSALEQAAKRAEIANRAKSQFLAKMSHELRTPLNAILGFTQLMSRDSSLPPDYQEHLNIISRSGEHLLVLINDVLEMSKIEAGQLKLNESCFDLHRLIGLLKEMFMLKALDKGLTLIVESSPDVPQYVCGDEAKLRQILINLVGNAIKFTTTGYVSLRVKTNLEHKKGMPYTLILEVEDTGPGIADADLESIFEAFVQAEQGRYTEGTGLGLSISRQFAQLMGGDVTVQSTLGQGTVFTCQVQLSVTETVDLLPTPMTQRVFGLEPGQPSYRILVVEDVLENRQLLVKLLDMVGFEVRSVEDGVEAIEQWQVWQPHLIWMDIQMPGMNGYEVTRQIRVKEAAMIQASSGDTRQLTNNNLQNYHKTIIIALTANAFTEDREAALQAGCDDYISKPFAETVLFDKMAQYLGLRYVYSDATPSHAAQTISKHLTFEDLQVMPSSWISQVHNAAMIIDETELNLLIEQIPPQHQALADTLKNLVDNFQLKIILDLTQPQ